VAFSPDSRLLGVSGTRGSAQVQLFEVVSGRPLAPIATGEDARALAFSSDGQDLVMVLRSGSVAIVPELIRPATHSEITKAIFSVDPEGTPQNLLTAVAFTPERNIVTLSVPGDISIRLMRLTLIPPETDSVWYGPLEEISEDICVSTISPNGKMAAFTGPLESLRLYDVAAGRLQHSLPGFRGVTSLSFSWNGRVLASGHGDEKARLWDVATGREIHAFSGYGPVTAVAVTPAGQTVATGHDDGAVRLWDVPSGRMIATLLALSGDNWATLLPDDSFTLAQPTTELWWAVKLCRFSADEIADLDPGVRRRDPSTPIPR